MGLLSSLPPAPQGRSGWPWTEESDAPAQAMANGAEWPLISIVTPSFNQGEYLEETIRSVLLQNYPNLEYIIMDGGSSDDSVDIIRKYSPWLNHWVSEKDDGQSAAINTGMGLAKGSIVNWVCSDDVLTKDALAHVAELSARFPESVAWAGKCHFMHADGRVFMTAHPIVGEKRDFARWGSVFGTARTDAWVGQPSCFFRGEAFQAVGGVNEDLHFAMDVDLWMRLAEQGPFSTTEQALSYIRWYDDIKTLQDYPGRMLEHVVINWNQGLKEESRYKMLQFGQIQGRDHILDMGLVPFTVLSATWLYRKTLKTPLTRIKQLLARQRA